jgi:hypothetical protein
LLHPGVELYKIKMLGLPRHHESLITGGNIARLLVDAGMDTNYRVSHVRENNLGITYSA